MEADTQYRVSRISGYTTEIADLCIKTGKILAAYGTSLDFSTNVELMPIPPDTPNGIANSLIKRINNNRDMAALEARQRKMIRKLRNFVSLYDRQDAPENRGNRDYSNQGGSYYNVDEFHKEFM